MYLEIRTNHWGYCSWKYLRRNSYYDDAPSEQGNVYDAQRYEDDEILVSSLSDIKCFD